LEAKHFAIESFIVSSWVRVQFIILVNDRYDAIFLPIHLKLSGTLGRMSLNLIIVGIYGGN